MNGKFIVLEQDILESEFLTSNEKILYGFISALSNNENGECYAYNEVLAELCGIKRRMINYSLAKLKKYNFITIRYDNNKRFIKPTINAFIEERDKMNKKIVREELEDYDWLNE